jgi:hypothetical protein
LVQTKGAQRSFQPSVKRSIAAIRSVTLAKLSRRMACRVMIEKKTSTRFSQDPEVGVKCRVIRGCRASQAHRGVFVGGVLVHHQVQSPARVGLGDLFEEPQELLPGQARLGDLAGGHLERGEQGGGAVADVVVGLALRVAGQQRQDRSGPVEGLHLRFLVHAQHHRLVRRVQIQPHDVADLRLQLRVGGELERLGPPGLQPPLPPDLAHPDMGDAELGAEQPRRPVRHGEPL